MGVAPLVFEEVSTGDRVVRSIISKPGHELGRTAGAVIERMDYKGNTVKIVLKECLNRQKAPMIESFEGELSNHVSSWTYTGSKCSSAEGALIKAGKLARG